MLRHNSPNQFVDAARFITSELVGGRSVQNGANLANLIWVLFAIFGSRFYSSELLATTLERGSPDRASMVKRMAEPNSVAGDLTRSYLNS